MNHRWPLSRAIRWTIIGTGPLAAVVAGALWGVEIAILVLAGAALSLVIAMLWASVQSLTGSSPLSFEEALSLGAPSAEEEQKRSVLRALKDLEYERSVGKISPQDYAELSTRYRTEAKRLIQALDQDLSGTRHKAEALLGRRLRALEPSSPVTPDPSPPLERICAACAARNELDANFCKGCGTRMSSPPDRPCPACAVRYSVELSACPACGAQVEKKP